MMVLNMLATMLLRRPYYDSVEHAKQYATEAALLW